jgi:murein L,D-transpeptidase YcbB/YkuD
MDAADIEQLRRNRRTRSVFLEQPIPVLLMYWTAEVGRDGQIHFYDDVYERDSPLLEALDSAYSVALADTA